MDRDEAASMDTQCQECGKLISFTRTDPPINWTREEDYKMFDGATFVGHATATGRVVCSACHEET